MISRLPLVDVHPRRDRTGCAPLCSRPDGRSRSGRARRSRRGMPSTSRTACSRSGRPWQPSHTAPRPSPAAATRMFSVAAEQSCTHQSEIDGSPQTAMARAALGQHLAIGVCVGQSLQCALVGHDDQVPGLPVRCRGRGHARLEQAGDLLIGHRFACVSADAASCKNDFESLVHCALLFFRKPRRGRPAAGRTRVASPGRLYSGSM